MRKPAVDKAKCIGCGTCTILAPKTFKLGNDGKAEIINPSGDEEEKIKEAVDSCPVEAIYLGK
ncbi:MAG TPA: ferredoxin [Patescibacteria group bacterium]|nr:ferredoxin [Patescibacteria group bacterium]